MRSQKAMTQGRAAAEQVLDPAVYGTLRSALSDAVLIEIYTLFLSDTEARICGLLATTDAEAVRRALHSVRGTAGMIGARAVAAIAGRLEQHRGALSAKSLAPLEAACNQLRETLIAGGLAV